MLLSLGMAAAVIAALTVWLWPHGSKPAATAAPPLRVTNVVAAAQGTGTTVTRAISANATDPLQLAAVGLSSAENAVIARQQLEALRRALSTMPPAQAAAAIRKFLDSKADAATRQGFKVGGKGLLEEAPTLRVFLLDYLERIDPAAAADYARGILSSMDSPDEWAVALRNLALGDNSAGTRGLLEQKLGQMLQNSAWQQNPSVGFLEAFDVAPYLGGTGLVPTLTDLVRKQDNPAVAHAAFLALDRLVINNTTATLAALEAAPDQMQGRELTRADFFARADLRDPAQRQVLETYLLDPHLGTPELDHFVGVFPNANYMISQNLLTPTPTPTGTALRDRDAESLRIVQTWLGDPRFDQLKPYLERTRRRLEGFMGQAGQ